MKKKTCNAIDFVDFFGKPYKRSKFSNLTGIFQTKGKARSFSRMAAVVGIASMCCAFQGFSMNIPLMSAVRETLMMQSMELSTKLESCKTRTSVQLNKDFLSILISENMKISNPEIKTERISDALLDKYLDIVVRENVSMAQILFVMNYANREFRRGVIEPEKVWFVPFSFQDKLDEMLNERAERVQQAEAAAQKTMITSLKGEVSNLREAFEVWKKEQAIQTDMLNKEVYRHEQNFLKMKNNTRGLRNLPLNDSRMCGEGTIIQMLSAIELK